MKNEFKDRICVTSLNGNWVLVDHTNRMKITDTVILPGKPLDGYFPEFECAIGPWGVYSINDPRKS